MVVRARKEITILFLIIPTSSNSVTRIIIFSIFGALLTLWAWTKIKRNRKLIRKVGYFVWILGVFSNFTVILANGGWMPVLGKKTFENVWMPMSDTTIYNQLGDRFLKFSIGDFLILGALLFLMVENLLQLLRHGRSTS